MTWTPDDALVEKAARAACIEACLDNSSEQACEFCKRHQMWTAYAAEARAALIACRDDMVAEAVKAERRAVYTFLDKCHQTSHCAAVRNDWHDGYRGGISDGFNMVAAFLDGRHP